MAIACVFLMTAPVAPAHSQQPAASPGNYHDSPVFYETEPVPYFLAENRELLHRNQLKLRAFPAVDVSEWDWKTGPIKDFSWWIQVEELRFLLPLLKSEIVEDRELARRWFWSWYESDRRDVRGNQARWREPMSAAYRGTVLVYFLKTEDMREDSSDELRRALREVIGRHQKFLADPSHFSTTTNHGLFEAFGLLEVTRVFPDAAHEDTGLDRMLLITRKSVSKMGTHKEHSPVYHFAFLNWLDRYSAYLRDNTTLDRGRIAELVDYADQMKAASYYLCDHDGTVPEVGDSDSTNASCEFPQYAYVDSEDEPTFYDPEAGYAIFKDRRRYVVFAIQSGRIELPNHYHDDVLSVYYRYAGETILGDPGKYQYTKSSLRTWYVSAQAHNTVFPTVGERQMKQVTGKSVARSVSREGAGDGVLFAGTVNRRAFVAKRSVSVPDDGRTLSVVDEIRAGAANPVARQRSRNRRHPAESQQAPPSATVLWNFGYSVVSVVPDPDAGIGRFSFTLTTSAGRKLRLAMEVADESGNPTDFTHEIVRGRVQPKRGWYAPAMYVERPVYALGVDIPLETAVVVQTCVEQVEARYFPGWRVLVKGY